MKIRADWLRSIAKYTGDVSHYQKFNPSIPEPVNPETLIEEIFGPPKRYFEQVANSIPPAQSSRTPAMKSTTDAEGLQMLPNRNRAISRASTIVLPTAADPASTEPRIVPGVLHENERRRGRRISGSGGSEAAITEAITPGLAKMTVKEQEEVDRYDQSD